MRVDVRVLGGAPPGLIEGVLGSLPPPLTRGALSHTLVDLSRCFDSDRNQLDAACVLAQLPEGGEENVVVGISDLDLFLPVLTFVFGVSALSGRRSLVSWRRLRPEGEEGRAGPVLIRRLTIELLHEVGHAIGLVHCVVPDCVMHRAASPEAVDLKRPEFCPSCLNGLEPVSSRSGES